MKKRKNEIIRAGRILYEKGLLAGFDGNISMRFNDNIMITATGVYKGFLKDEDILIMDYQGNIIKGKKKQTSEFRLHLMVYQKREDVKTIVHAHPPLSTAMTIAEIPFIPCLTAETYIMLGLIPIVPYTAPGGQELADSIVPYLESTDIMMLKQHGVLSYGKDFFTCLDRIEKMEDLARKIFALLQAGINIEEYVFFPQERKSLEDLKNKYGFRNVSCICKEKVCPIFKEWRERNKGGEGIDSRSE